jgi:hypothetical protein
VDIKDLEATNGEAVKGGYFVVPLKQVMVSTVNTGGHDQPTQQPTQ